MIRKGFCSWLVQLITMAGISISSCYGIEMGAVSRRSVEVIASSPPGVNTKWSPRDRKYIPHPNESDQTQITENEAPKERQKIREEISGPSIVPTSVTQIQEEPIAEPIADPAPTSIEEAQGHLHTLVTHPIEEEKETGCQRNRPPLPETGLMGSALKWESKNKSLVGRGSQKEVRKLIKNHVLSYLNAKQVPKIQTNQDTDPSTSLSSGKVRHFQKQETTQASKQLPSVGVALTHTASKKPTFQQGTNDARFKDEIAQNFVRPPKQHLPFRHPENPILEDEIAQELPQSSAATVPAKPASNPQAIGSLPAATEEAFINFNDISIVQYLNFISKLTNKNFIFDKADLDFNVTIISTKPTSIENVMATLLQELRVHNLSLMEVGNNLIIHRNETTNSPGTVIGHEEAIPKTQDYITKVFVVENTPPQNLIDILQPLLSHLAIVESNPATNHLIITDIAPNIEKVSQIIEKLDKPFTGSEVGQYVIQNESVETVVQLLRQLMEPIAGETPISIVPHTTTNSIFIVSSTHLVEKAMAILKKIDSTAGETRILSIQNLRKEEDISSLSRALSKNLQEMLQRYLRGLSPEERLRLQNEGDESSSNRIPGSQADREAILNYLRSLSAEERARLLQENAPRTKPAPPKVEEKKDEDYLTPAEKLYLDRASKAQRFEFGKGRSKLLEQNDLFFDGIEELGAPTSGESKQGQWQAGKPSPHLDSTEFIVHKLLNRQGNEIVTALHDLAEKLAAEDKDKQQPSELLMAINSIQLLESSNSLLITGSPRSITKVRDLIYQLDIPVRQVLVEMLIIRTSLNDSLSYGVNLETRFGGGETEGGNHSNLIQDPTLNNQLNVINGSSSLIPNFFNGNTFNLGVIGRNVHHGSLVFNSIGALVTALHTDNRVQVVLNPKIVVEDNKMAEVFVGINTAYTTETITSSQNNQITQNVEYRDVGTSLKVTPHIRHNDMITLEIEQEISDEVTNQQNNSSSSNNVQTTASSATATVTNVGPTTNKSKTKTVVHIPNEYFLILSGLMQKQESQINTQIPCLGGLPFIGGLFKSRGNQDNNSNIMIFIRPMIIEGQKMHVETKRQQDIFREKTRNRHRGEYETEEALDYFNLKETYDWAQE